MMTSTGHVCKILLSVALFLTSLADQRAQGSQAASGSGSHGGDNKWMAQRSAWFPWTLENHTKRVRYCYQISADFAVQDHGRITKAIEDAFYAWYRYIAGAIHEGNQLNIFNGDWLLQGSDLKDLIEYEPECGPHSDIKYYLGVENEDIRQRKNEFRHPAAFSHITSRDSESAWVKGYVWIHPGSPYELTSSDSDFSSVQKIRTLNWQKPQSLELLMKHEMGHIMGVQHIPQTIMDENFLDRLPTDGTEDPAFLSIDRSNRGMGMNPDTGDRRILQRREEIVEIYLKDLKDFVSLNFANDQIPANLVKATMRSQKWFEGGQVTIQGEGGQQKFNLVFEPAKEIFGSMHGAQVSLGEAVIFCYPPLNAAFEFKCTALNQTAFVKEFKLKKLGGGYETFLLFQNMRDREFSLERMGAEFPHRDFIKVIK